MSYTAYKRENGQSSSCATGLFKSGNHECASVGCLDGQAAAKPCQHETRKPYTKFTDSLWALLPSLRRPEIDRREDFPS